MVAFTNLLAGLQHYSDLWKRPVARITHDQQSDFQGTLNQYHQIYSGASPEPLKWAGETHVWQKVAGSEFVMREDSESPTFKLPTGCCWPRKVGNSRAVAVKFLNTCTTMLGTATSHSTGSMMLRLKNMRQCLEIPH
jgi:hypothetical protein